MMSLNAKPSYDDRFIPERNKTDVANFNLEHIKIDSLSDINFEDEEDCYLQPVFVNTAKKANHILSYRKKLLNALDMTYSSVLKYTKPRKTRLDWIAGEMSPWPVKARKKPVISAPKTVLDMPDIDTMDTFLCRQSIDWGKQGQIATIFNKEVHLWSCENVQVARTQTERTITECVKWNRSGEKFAVSRSHSRISIMDGETLKVIRTVTCKCTATCTTTAIEWSTNGKVISGCSRGSITVLSNATGPNQHFYHLMDGEIVDLQLSCNNTYLLVSTLQANTCIFKWPLSWNVAPAMIFSHFDKIKSTAWHPWRESRLAVGETDNGIAIWNVNNLHNVDYKVVEPYFKESSTCILDYLTFNPVSAELLVSFYHENPDPNSSNGCNFLTVFSDLHTRVDEVRYHIGRVPHVLWNGTGTKLATVGTDENLVLWDFFGTEYEIQETRKCQKKRKKKCPKLFGTTRQFGMCIR